MGSLLKKTPAVNVLAESLRLSSPVVARSAVRHCKTPVHCLRRSNRLRRPLNPEHGATILEAALAFPVLLLIILSLVDLSRLMLVRNVIEESMHRVSEYATTVPNLDINPLDYSASDIEFKRYKKARELSIAAGEQFLESVGYIDANGDSELNFLDFTRTFTDTANSPSTVTGKLMLLLPGECAQYGPNTADQECNLAPLGAGANQIPTAPAAALMKNYPLRIVARANIETFTPFIPNFNLQIESYSYRQPIPQTPFNAEIEAELGNTDFASDPSEPPPLLNPADEEDEFVPTSCVENAGELVAWSKAHSGTAGELKDEALPGGNCRPDVSVN